MSACEERLALAPHVRFRRDTVRGGGMLLAPDRGYALTPTALAIVELIDGERGVAEVVARLAASYAAPRSAVDQDVRSFVAHLLRARLVVRKAAR
jgi:pyrroloquinoline quinone biosynthesis protein D